MELGDAIFVFGKNIFGKRQIEHNENPKNEYFHPGKHPEPFNFTGYQFPFEYKQFKFEIKRNFHSQFRKSIEQREIG